MNLWKDTYLTKRFFTALLVVIGLFVLGHLFPVIKDLAFLLLALLSALLLIDLFLLFRSRKGFFAHRECSQKFSNGDENPVDIYLQSRYNHPIWVEVIDEIPHQFQRRDLSFKLQLRPGEEKVLKYELRPVKRGSYEFGAVNVFVKNQLGLAARRYRFSQDQEVAVYPSYVQMRQYELLAISHELTMSGIKKIRRIGSNREFEQIEKYIPGDDYRSINWKATARKNELMVNHYQDERSQNVYSLIDKGRMMKMPFDGLSLLDYAINASLVISNIAMRKGDRPGLISFQHQVSSIVPASARNRQMQQIMEQLYNEKTSYLESDLSMLYAQVRRRINQRSLLLLFTNFESIHSLKRQLPYLKMMARQHLLVVIFFENTEVRSLAQQPASGLEEIYTKGIAEQLLYEKKLIVKELASHGIQSVLTAPKDLSVNTINKYLELKARGLV